MHFGKRTIPVLAVAFCASAGQVLAANGVPQPSHIVVVMEENHSYNEIVGSSSAPYINNTLIAEGALFTSSFGVEHPSEPNYLDLFSGSNQGVTADYTCPFSFTTANLGLELQNASKTFTGYAESMPSNGDTGCDSAPYYVKHNPWVQFSNLPNGNVTGSDNLTFASYPQNNFPTLPTVSFVIPNINDDMHDGTIQQGDTWLQQNIDQYAQWAKANNGLLIVTWDEDDSSQSNQIPTIFVGQQVVPGKYSETINHYNVLRTIEDAYGLTYAGNSATATTISNIWASSSLAAPTLNASAGTASVDLSWTASTGATSYNVYRSTSSGGEGVPAIATGLTGTSYTDTSVVGGTKYYYTVRAVNSTGTSVASNEASATPASTGIANGTYKIVCELSGLAFDDPNAGGSGTGVDQQAYSGTNQQWVLTSLGNGKYEIASAANGLALSGPTAGAQLVLQSYTGASNQQWSFTAAGSYYNIVNAATGQVADDFGQSTASGNPIGQWTANGGTNQNWSLVSIPTGLANGTYRLTPQCATGSSLDANGWGTTNGTKVDIWSTVNQGNELWTFTNMGNGWYKIQPSYSTTLSLEVNGGGTTNGSTVDLWADVGQTNERWSATAVTGGYELQPENASGQSLNVNGNGSANGTKVQLWQYSGQSGSIWSIQ
jgi:hypothetical protein